MDDTITPRETFEYNLFQQPSSSFTIKSTENEVQNNTADGVIHYEISESDLERLASESNAILFRGEKDKDVVCDVLQEIVENVSSTIDLEELVVANGQVIEYKQQQQIENTTEGTDFNVNQHLTTLNSQSVALEVPYERKKKSKNEESFHFGRFFCYWCDQRFRCYSHLKQHVQKHLATNPNKCDICGKVFTQKSTLNTHMFIHTGERPHKCVQCGRGFITKSKLRQHVRVHTGLKPHKCDICNAKFGSSFSLRMHKNKNHKKPAETRILMCSKCPKQFSEEEELEKHEKETHSVASCGGMRTIAYMSNGDVVYQCEICEKTFQQQKNLKKHLWRHRRPKYQCTICDKQFAAKDTWKAHIGQHTGEQPYQCQICNVKFSVKAYLKRHMTVHIDTAMHECDVCHGKYRSLAYLARHKKIHQERIHKCSMCTSRFVTTGDLKRHTRKHTGEKPFACQYCAQRFTQSSSLRKHREKKHPIVPQVENNIEVVQQLIQWIDTHTQGSSG